MFELLYLFAAMMVIGAVCGIGCIIMDKLCPEEDEEVLEYDEQIRRRKRAKTKGK